MFIDLAFLILMVLAVFKGYSRGFVVALFSVIAIVLGIAAAMKLSATVAVYLQDKMSITGHWLPFLSFAIVLIGVILLVRLGAALIEKTMQVALLGWANRLLGIILYVILYGLILSVIVFYAIQLKLISAETIAASKTWPYLQPWGPWAMEGIGKLIPAFKNMFQQLQDFFERMSHKP